MDIALYCQDRLRYIASRKNLGAEWPGPQLLSEFQRKAEGLFIWVVTVSEYISNPRTFNSDGKFKSLLKSRPPRPLCRSKLCSEILGNCDWSDEDVPIGY